MAFQLNPFARPRKSVPLFDIAVDDADYKRIQGILRTGYKDVDKVIRNAVNRTAGTGANLVRRALKEKVNVTDKDIARAITSRKAGPGELTSTVTISKKQMPLRAYKPTQTKRGVRVKFRKDGQARVFSHLFIKDMPAPDETGSPAPGNVKQSTQVVGRGRNLPSKGPNMGGKRTMTLNPKRRKVYLGKQSNVVGKRKNRGSWRWQYLSPRPYTTTTKIKLTKKGVAGSFAIVKRFGPSMVYHFGEKGTTDIARKALAGIRETLRKNLDNQVRWFLSGRRNITESQREAS